LRNYTIVSVIALKSGDSRAQVRKIKRRRKRLRRRKMNRRRN